MRYKAVNYSLAMAEWQMEEKDAQALPFSIQFNRDDHCNLKCVYCRPIGTHFPGLKTMPFEQWLPAVETLLPAAVEFMPFCWGEPLLPSAHFREACLASRRFGTQLAIITHLNTVDQEHADLFVEYVSRALISVDTANADSYRKLRAGGSLDNVERNITMLRERAMERGVPIPWLGISAVIMAQNLDDLPNLIDWAAENCLNGVYAGRLVAPEGIRDWARSELVDLTTTTYRDVYMACKARATRHGLPLSMHDPDNPIGANRMCPCPWQHAYISSDGGMSFCNFSREIVLDHLPVSQDFWWRGLVSDRRKKWHSSFRCSGCQSTDYDGRPGVSQFRGQ